MKAKYLFIFLASLLLLFPLFSHYAFAGPFYEGKVIKLIVATNPGGGYDFYGRMTAKYMQKYLPGIKTIIVKNVPGAGHMIGCNEIYNSKPDGLTFGHFEKALIVAQLCGMKGVKYDFAKMSWLGSATSEPRAFVVAKHITHKTLKEAINTKMPIRFATAGIGGMDYMDAVLIAFILGAKNWQIATGYSGREDFLAMMRGEMDASFASWSSIQNFVAEGSGRPLMFTADKAMKGYEDIPILPDVVEKKYKNVVDLELFLVKLSRCFAGPPGIPADRLQILREAFDKTWHDSELLEQMKKAKRPVNFIGAQEAEKLVKDTLNQPPDVIKLIKKAYGIKG